MKAAKIIWSTLSVAMFLALAPASAHAVALSAVAVDVPDVVAGEDRWRFDYSLSGPLAASHGVNLIFPFDDFADLSVVTPPPASDWDVALTPIDALSGFDGLLTLTALADLDAAYTTGFSVGFIRLTANAIGPQGFEVFYDNFDIEDSGNLVVTTASPPPVPEPATWALFLFGAVLLGGAQWRRSSAVS